MIGYLFARFTYAWVHGQDTRHFMQVVHLYTSIMSSLWIEVFHIQPFNTLGSQTSWHILQAPHLGRVGGCETVANGASVSTVPKQIALPYWLVTSRLCLPIHPIPVNKAIVL